MHSILLDTRSPYHVRIPYPDQWFDLIEVSQDFVIYDQSLPPEQRCHYTPYIVELLQTCIPLCDAYETSKSQRTIASEGVKRLDEQAVYLTRRIHQMIKSCFYDTPEQAEAWGFQIKQSTQSILLPQNRKERLAMLKKYIAKEESRPAEERFTTPDLATIKQVREDLVANLAARRTKRDQRKSSRAARDKACGQLVDCLRMAAGDVMLRHFGHKISYEMQQWGFEIVERQNNRADRSEEAVGEAVKLAQLQTSPAPEATVNGSSLLNGSVETVADLDGEASGS